MSDFERLERIESLLHEVINLLQTNLKTNARWSPKEITTLKRMYKEGKSLEDIAKTLNRAKPTVYSHLCRLRIKGEFRRNRLSPDITSYIEQNYLSLSYAKIAEHLGISKDAVMYHVRKQIKSGKLKSKNKK